VGLVDSGVAVALGAARVRGTSFTHSISPFSRSSCPTPIPPNLRVKAPATVATATTAAFHPPLLPPCTR
jgi:hypothetical protein